MISLSLSEPSSLAISFFTPVLWRSKSEGGAGWGSGSWPRPTHHSRLPKHDIVPTRIAHFFHQLRSRGTSYLMPRAKCLFFMHLGRFYFCFCFKTPNQEYICQMCSLKTQRPPEDLQSSGIPKMLLWGVILGVASSLLDMDAIYKKPLSFLSDAFWRTTFHVFPPAEGFSRLLLPR